MEMYLAGRNYKLNEIYTGKTRRKTPENSRRRGENNIDMRQRITGWRSWLEWTDFEYDPVGGFLWTPLCPLQVGNFFMPADSLGLCELSKRSFTMTPVILQICISWWPRNKVLDRITYVKWRNEDVFVLVFVCHDISGIDRVSQEECAILRESVPYVKLYRYNPKHLYPKLNGFRDNGQRSLKLWQLLHTYWLPNTYWNWQGYVVYVMLISVLNIKVTCEWHKAIKLNYKNTRNNAAGVLEFQALCIWNAILSCWVGLVHH